MKPLANARHERFAQELAKGASADEAYALASYRADRGNASRLTANDNVRGRVADLKAAGAERAVVSIASITERLLAIATAAEGSDEAAMLQVARAALMDAAKLNGLIVDRARVETGGLVRVLSSEPLTDEEWAAK